METSSPNGERNCVRGVPSKRPGGVCGTCGGVCDDTQAAINPGALENCTDTVDNNCDDPTCTEDPACIPSDIPAPST